MSGFEVDSGQLSSGAQGHLRVAEDYVTIGNDVMDVLAQLNGALGAPEAVDAMAQSLGRALDHLQGSSLAWAALGDGARAAAESYDDTEPQSVSQLRSAGAGGD